MDAPTLNGIDVPERQWMRRMLRWMGQLVAGLAVCLALGVLAFDLTVVQPCVDRIKRELQAAAPSERQPPAVLLDMLQRAYGGNIRHQVVRDVAGKSVETVPHVARLHRRAVEAGLLWLLPWHLTDAELASSMLANAYMGPDVRGFAAASERYLGMPLERAGPEQAARLVAISWAPNILLEDPDRLRRRVQVILAKPPALARP
jgi:hypothetical protein